MIASVGGALLAMFGFSKLMDIDTSVLPIATVLGLGLSIDYALLMVNRFREERGHGADIAQAVERTAATAGRTVAFSGLTVAVALSGLFVFTSPVFRAVGAAGVSVVVIAVVVCAVEWVRVPSRAIPVFLLVVTIGDSLATNAVKTAIDRARPAIDPVAATLGPSFPSGHSKTAAVVTLGLVLLFTVRGRGRRLLIGAGAAYSLVMAWSRTYLRVHWLTDVVWGLALGTVVTLAVLLAVTARQSIRRSSEGTTTGG